MTSHRAEPNGRFVVEVVGIDGAGKSSVVAALADAFDGTPRKVSPYGPAFEEAALQVSNELGTHAEGALRACAVAGALVREAAVPVTGIHVFDRYLEAARMFFAVKGVQPLAEEFLTSLPAPNLVVLLDVDVSTGLARRARQAGRSPAEELAYMEACVDYLRQAARERGWPVIDARQVLAVVIGEAQALVASHAMPLEAGR